MKMLSPIELLDIRDACLHLSPLDKSLYLLGILYETNSSNIAQLSVGERDARLLAFRKSIFGARLINMAHCPHCNGIVEWEASVDDMRLQDITPDGQAKILRLESNGYTIHFRLPNSDDIIKAISRGSSIDASAFISSCVLRVDQQEQKAPEILPENVLDEISKRMAEADPQADLTMLLSCPECNNQWQAPFDILQYLWLEIESWARRMLKEVAVMAKHFGWSEREILSLSPIRRQQYLEIIQA